MRETSCRLKLVRRVLGLSSFIWKSIQVDGLTYCLNLSKKLIHFQIVFFAGLTRVFCLQRNVVASSARGLGVWLFLAEMFEKPSIFFHFQFWRFFGWFFCDLALLPLRLNFIIDNSWSNCVFFIGFPSFFSGFLQVFLCQLLVFLHSCVILFFSFFSFWSYTIVDWTFISDCFYLICSLFGCKF